MTLKEVTKSRSDSAWKLYNYLNNFERLVFGCKKKHNAISILILTVVELHGSLSTSDISDELGLPYSEIYRYVDNLEKYFHFLERCEDSALKVCKTLKDNAEKESLKFSKDTQKVFTTVIANVKYHTKIFQDNLGSDSEQNVGLIRSLLNPVISNPIAVEDCRQLSRLGYMKYRPQKKELKLNAVAYLKDWVGATRAL